MSFLNSSTPVQVGLLYCLIAYIKKFSFVNLVNFMFRDSSFLIKISNNLEKFHSSRGTNFSFRCPYCGDSKKDPDKTRGCLKEAPWDNTKLIYKCFNCGIFRTFRNFLRDIDNSIYREYIRESLRHDNSFIGSDKGSDFWEIPSLKALDPIRKNPLPEDFFVQLESLSSNHPAIRYVESRKIPCSKWKYIWYTDDFRSIAHNLDPEKYSKEGQIFPESRLILPGMTPDGSRMTFFQGRSLEPDAKVRYIMIWIDRSSDKLFGIERVNPTLPVIVLEGPIDTFFVDNSIAQCGATHAPSICFRDRIFFMDQEPRNPNIINKMHLLVESGEKIVILPDKYIELDPNEIHLKYGLSSADIRNLAIENTYSGQKAKLELARWQVTNRFTTRKVQG